MSPLWRFSSCPICQASNQKEVFCYSSFRYVRCCQCGLVWMNPLFKDDYLEDDYEKLDWSAYNHFISTFRKKQFQRDITFLEKFCSEKGYLLDIGTGTGEFLGMAQQHGFVAYGLESSKKAGEQASKYGQVIIGEFETLKLKENFFKVITLWSVLEHVPQPKEFLIKAHRLLQDGGLLALRLPLSSSLINWLSLWAYKLSGHRLSWPLRHFYQLDWHSRHYYLFTKTSLLLLLKRTGFQPLWLKRDSGFDPPSLKFRLRLSFQNWFFERILFTLAWIIFGLAKFLQKEDELVLIARKI